jgi:hypothetical protein
MPRIDSSARFAASVTLSLAVFAGLASAQTYTPIKDIPGSNLMRRMQSAMGGIGQGGDIGNAKWDVEGKKLWFDGVAGKNGWHTLDLTTASGDRGRLAHAARRRRSLRRPGARPAVRVCREPRRRVDRGERRWQRLPPAADRRPRGDHDRRRA